MTITAPLTPSAPPAGRTGPSHPTRTTRDDASALPAVLRSEWIKLSSVRANRAIVALNLGVCAFAAWAVATLVTDEVLTVSQVFVFPTLLTAVFAAVAGILLFSSEVQHGTLAVALTAQPGRWVIAAGKTVTALGFGLALGATGMVAGFAGASACCLELGDTASMSATVVWALLFTSMAGAFGLGVGMIARHSAGAISGLLVWWFVIENLVIAFAPATLSRFLPFDAGYHLLGVGSDMDGPARIAAALSRAQAGLVFTAYAVVAVIAGSVLLQRRDAS